MAEERGAGLAEPKRRDTEQRRSTLLQRKAVGQRREAPPRGRTVVIYKGGNDFKSAVLPGKFFNELKAYTDGTGDGDGMSTYIFDRISHDGRRWVTCEHPGHLVYFLYHPNPDGGTMFQVLLTREKQQEILAFRKEYTVDILTGHMALRKDFEQAMADADVMLNEAGKEG